MLRRSPLLLGIAPRLPAGDRAAGRPRRGYATPSRESRSSTRTTCRRVVTIGGQRFHVDRTIGEVSKNVEPRRGSPRDEAERQLAAGQVVAVVTVPPGFLATLEEMVEARSSSSSLARHHLRPGRAAGAGARLLASTGSSRARTSPRPAVRDLILQRRRRHLPRPPFNVLGLERRRARARQMPQTAAGRHARGLRPRRAARPRATPATRCARPRTPIGSTT